MQNKDRFIMSYCHIINIINIKRFNVEMTSRVFERLESETFRLMTLQGRLDEPPKNMLRRCIYIDANNMTKDKQTFSLLFCMNFEFP